MTRRSSFLRYAKAVPISAVKAIAPDLPVNSSSTGTSHYTQKRTALFGRIAFLCSLIGLLIRGIADTVMGHPERVMGPSYLYLAICSLTLFGLWLFTRGKPRPLGRVRLAELVALSTGMVVASFGFRLSTPDMMASSIVLIRSHGGFASLADPAFCRIMLEFAGLILSLLVCTQILCIRAALVPSTLRHSLALSAMVGVPICLFTGLAWPAMMSSSTFPFDKEERMSLVIFGFNWWLFTGAACGVIARVVHRLQTEVRVARRLGQYELGEKIGQGGMGVVYRARHAMMKRPVAIKLLPAEAAGQEAITRFEREVQLTSQLSHPNTVVIHDYGRTHEGVFYYVMEFIEGATLEQIRVAAGPMPSERVVRILEMIAGSLGEAHDHGLVHRDIKPANILLGPRGGEPDVAKVLDFGLVRPIRANTSVTETGIVMGTPLFMSPEAMRHPDRVETRSDLYSLGALAYYMLSGRYVFLGETAIDICVQHMQTPPRPLSELVPDIDPELERLVLQCLAKDPAQRPISAHALSDALYRCPSRAKWTRERATEWWALHARLLRPKDPPDARAADQFRPTERVPQG